MSRLIVKNLPKQIKEDDIRKHFGQSGNITDIKLVYKDGEFRRYGFIGYEKEDEADEACKYFHKTFIKQSRITVEMCHGIGSEKKPISWAEKNKEKKMKNNNSSNNDNNNEAVAEDPKKKKKRDKKMKREESADEQLPSQQQHEDDPKFADYLNAGVTGVKGQSTPSTKVPERDSDDDSDDDSEDDSEDDDEEEDDSEDDDEEEDDSEETESTLAKNKYISDQDYLKSLMKSKSEEKSDIEVTKKQQQQPKETKWKDYYTVVIRAHNLCKSEGRKFTKPAVKAFMKPLKCRSIRIPRNIPLVTFIGFKKEREMTQALQKDMSFLGGVRVNVTKHKQQRPADKSSSSSGESVSGVAPWKASEEKVKTGAEPVGESGSIFVRNLWYSVTEENIRELFGKYGEISDVNLPICKDTRRPKGFATITFLFPEHATKAMNKLDGSNFQGRVLHVLPAISHKGKDDDKKGPQSFKDKKAAEQKASAGSWHNWNTLFLGSSAVVDLMAQKYNRSKQEILESEGKQSVAVNLALGETQLVDETKRFLEDAGVSLAAFTSTGVQRSRTVMLVKNLSASTTAQELSQLFSRYGILGRVLLPPSGVTGLVEFLDAGEAKRAFKNLAYSRFKDLPLYLEWAPLAVFTSQPTKTTHNKEEEGKEGKEGQEGTEEDKEEKIKKEVEGEEAKENTTEIKKEADENKRPELPAPEFNTTIYVKNLNFNTTEEELRKHFERVGSVHTVMIARKRGQSQGYGFIQFQHTRHAQQALKDINQSVLDDHTLLVKLSEKTFAPQVQSSRREHDAGKQMSSKILVKNVPFQASNKEVRQLFAVFGELKSVRLPSKPGSSEHRGFGFVDFVSKEDAKKAFGALSLSTHLYDRRLVLEWAREEETVEELRRKTAQHFLAAGPPNKKARVQLDSQKMNNDNNNDDDA
ncbi:hypothetical protein Pmani_013522 [Petrolisthes manimaculis]|uniref:RRM domain-containing protein n=1 Tax=Petrolisthes manimaculis TaxID=1843537 RepID=A0AAE1PW99_9EUCA|nr:hypothetical protein Pmani_013522 [Petrolisthes manimaculis]